MSYREHTFEPAAFLIKTADFGMHKVIGHVNKLSEQLNIPGERENEQFSIAAFNCLRLKSSSPVEGGDYVAQTYLLLCDCAGDSSATPNAEFEMNILSLRESPFPPLRYARL